MPKIALKLPNIAPDGSKTTQTDPKMALNGAKMTQNGAQRPEKALSGFQEGGPSPGSRNHTRFKRGRQMKRPALCQGLFFVPARKFNIKKKKSGQKIIY